MQIYIIFNPALHTLTLCYTLFTIKKHFTYGENIICEGEFVLNQYEYNQTKIIVIPTFLGLFTNNE